jgi:chaperonin GroES
LAQEELKLERNPMKLKPLADRVVVRQTEAEEKTKSGIYLPDAAKEKPTKGKVTAVGPGKLDDNGKRTEVGVRVGDVVYYGKYSGTEVEIDGEKFVILRESDLLGVLE